MRQKNIHGKVPLNQENYLGYNDWQLPHIEDLYNLLDCRDGLNSFDVITIPTKTGGEKEISSCNADNNMKQNLVDNKHPTPFINTSVFPNLAEIKILDMLQEVEKLEETPEVKEKITEFKKFKDENPQITGTINNFSFSYYYSNISEISGDELWFGIDFVNGSASKQDKHLNPLMFGVFIRPVRENKPKE